MKKCDPEAFTLACERERERRRERDREEEAERQRETYTPLLGVFYAESGDTVTW